MAGMSNKISNVLGVPIPVPLRLQLAVRSRKNLGLKEQNYYRDNDNLVYLANKTSWVRLVSSINVTEEDFDYFKTEFPNLHLTNPEDLAKKFVLFGGTSFYGKLQDAGKETYNIRSGIDGDNPAYGILGANEIKKYGYRPMPGITDVKIETQGRLGSIRMATINFKVWDKMQLDIMDALYFKLGYTMFLEWGHTVYYDNGDGLTKESSLQKSEFNQLNIFEKDLKKEKILRQISENVDKTDGNYDAMLGMCTNFNFSYNQEGGFDCTIKIIALGALADSTKINQTQTLPTLYQTTIDKIVDSLKRFTQQQNNIKAEEDNRKAREDFNNKNNQAGSIQQQNLTISQYIINGYAASTIYSNPYKTEEDLEKGEILPYDDNSYDHSTFIQKGSVITLQKSTTTPGDFREAGGGI
jgi:hypothetical protein